VNEGRVFEPSAPKHAPLSVAAIIRTKTGVGCRVSIGFIDSDHESVRFAL
jgi:hypothetical protein